VRIGGEKMKVFAKMSKIQESELLSDLSWQCLFHGGNPVSLWNQIRGYTDEEGKQRRKELRKEGYIKVRKVKTASLEQRLYLVAKQEKKPTGNANSSAPITRKVQPLAKAPAYLGEFTRKSWNTMAQKVGLPTITTVGDGRLGKLSARFKESFGKPESVWTEVVDGVEASVKKYPALLKAGWLDFDYVVQNQKSFDKARQCRIVCISDRGQNTVNDHVPHYLGGKH